MVNAVDSLTSEEPFGMNRNLKKVIVSTVNIVFNSFVLVALLLLTIWIMFHAKPAFKRQLASISDTEKNTLSSSTEYAEILATNSGTPLNEPGVLSTIESVINPAASIPENYCHPLVYTTCLYIVYTVSVVFVLTLIMSIIKYSIKQMTTKKVEEESDDEQEDEKPGCTQQ